MNYVLPPWRSSVARALHRNRSLPNARYVQLATLDPHNRPKNRTVVFRGWLEPRSQLKFVVDIRSQKALNLLSGSSSWAEVCWYFPKTREQFRVSGKLVLVTAECLTDRYCKARQEVWQQMSDSGRVQFDWATPGADRSLDPDGFNPPQPFDFVSPRATLREQGKSDQQHSSANFCLLLLEPVAVDHLELRGEPQNRYSYELVDDLWVLRQVNP